MPDIIELGKRVKAKHPEYGDMPDIEVGRKVKAKYANEYADFTDVAEPKQAQAKPAPRGMLDTALDFAGGAIKGAVSDTYQGIKRMADAVPLNPIPGEEMRQLSQRGGATLPDMVLAAMGTSRERLGRTKDLIAGETQRVAQEASNAAAYAKRGDASSAIGYGVRAIPLAGAAIGGTAERLASGDAAEMGRGVGNLAALLGGPMAGRAVQRAAGATSEAAANLLTQSARKQMGQVLNATKDANKVKSAQIVPEMVDRGVTALTMKGLQRKAASKVETLGQAIDDAFDNLPDGTTVPVTKMEAAIKLRATGEHMMRGPGGEMLPKVPKESMRAMNNAQDMVDAIKQFAEKRPIVDDAGNTSFIEVIDASRLRKVRQYMDKIVNESGGFTATPKSASRAESAKMSREAIQQELAGDFPNIAAINKEFTFWKRMDEVVSATNLRREGQAKPLGRKVAEAGGVAMGAQGGFLPAVIGRYAMGALEALATSPAWRTVSATTKGRLAKYIADGNRPMVETTLRSIQRSLAPAQVAVSPGAVRPALASDTQPESQGQQ